MNQFSEKSSNEPFILVYHERAAEFCMQELQKLGVTHIACASTREEVMAVLDRVEILFCWRFPMDLFAKAPALRWVQLMGAGVDDVMMSNQLPEHVTLTRIVGQFGTAIAEYVFAEMLYLVKNLAKFQEQQQISLWKPMKLSVLTGKILAVAGLGSIGAEIIRLGRAFGMHTIGLSRTGAHQHLVDQHFFPEQWGEFVQQADVIVITLPYTESTRAVVDKMIFEQMKSTVMIVNIGRGAVINEADLIAFLQTHPESAAILDVFEMEPLSSENPLWRLPNAVVTPHISGPSSTAEVSDFFFANLKRYLTDVELYGIVDRSAQY